MIEITISDLVAFKSLYEIIWNTLQQPTDRHQLPPRHIFHTLRWLSLPKCSIWTLPSRLSDSSPVVVGPKWTRGREIGIRRREKKRKRIALQPLGVRERALRWLGVCGGGVRTLVWEIDSIFCIKKQQARLWVHFLEWNSRMLFVRVGELVIES